VGGAAAAAGSSGSPDGLDDDGSRGDDGYGRSDDEFFDAESASVASSSFGSFVTGGGRSMMSAASGFSSLASLAHSPHSPHTLAQSPHTRRRSTLTSTAASTAAASSTVFSPEDPFEDAHAHDQRDGEEQEREEEGEREQQQDWADVVFRQWGARSPAYVGVDNELTMRMERASFALSRPTIASFWRCREEISTVIEALSRRPETDPAETDASAAGDIFSEGSGAASAATTAATAAATATATAAAAAASVVKGAAAADDEDDRVTFRLVLQLSKVGLYKSNPVVTHSLKAPGFNPWRL
jgi:hypothetical protein